MGKYKQGIVNKDEYEKIREDIISFLKNIKDPENNKNIVKNIYRWEEIYGNNAKNDPLDIIFDLDEEYGAQELLQPPEGFNGLFRSKNDLLSILSKPGFYDWMGDHLPDGIFFMMGENIKENKKIDTSVLDIVPTILAMMNIPIPNYIDGKLIKDAFIKVPKIKKEKISLDKESFLTDAEISKIKELKL
jgi:predicted AlkP superfamily phosphohydrolase/phosphomutase